MSRFYRGLTLMLVFATTLFISSGCDILEVENPGALTDKDFDSPTQIDFLLNSAIGNFQDAYPRIILSTGIVSDDLMPGSSETTYKRLDAGFFDIQVADQRPMDINNVYNQVSRARWVANYSTEKIKNQANANDVRIAKGLTYEALTYILLAENYSEYTIDGGPATPPSQGYQKAIDLLTEALSVANATNDAFAVNILGLLARVNYSIFAETNTAANLASAVSFAQQALTKDNRFILNAVYDQTAQPNYVLNNMNPAAMPLTPEYPFLDRKDIYSGNDEPRTPTGPFKVFSPDNNPVHDQYKYPSLSSPIPIVKWQEMNLILAENELLNGTIANALTFMNKNRAVAGLPNMTTVDADPAGEARDFLIYERASEFWLEGRRWMDMRHFDVPFTRWAPESINSGTDRKYPIPITERNTNENFADN